MLDVTNSLALLFESEYILINYMYSQPIIYLFTLSALNAWVNFAKYKFENSTLYLKQLTSMILEIDENVIIKLPDGQTRVLSKDFIEWFRGFTDAEGSFKFKNNQVNSFS